MTTTITSNPFARLTARFDAFLLSLQPCARALCTWLHRLYYSDRLSNGELLIDLTEFEDYSANRAKAPYTIRWIRRCYGQLVARGFIEEIRRSSANVRRVRLIHPDDVVDLETKILNSPDRDLESQNGNFKSTLGTSNPHSLVAESRSGNLKPSNANKENEQGWASSTIQAPAGDKSELLNRAKSLGATLTPALMQAVAAATYQQAANAIARVAEHIESGGHIKKSVDAFINFAIQNEAYPNSQRRRRSPVPTPPPPAAASPTPPPEPEPPKEEASPEPPEMPKQLMEWYELAHYCKACIGYRFREGDWQFYCPPEKWIGWEAATAMWSLKRLQKDKAKLDSVTKSS